ncbi:ADP-ribosylation/Crystallin J1 [Pseudocohnilembus persalinus]|uniref:ADP-ribosylation/Crystallin J1 n=1 Tax=Pseudocohnilembus persalinus TaxID=266149 RepID=A0A0V0R9Q2_PSEPJ|nr:ADP-ribosylation/Crystallin J1 [Pseudocohnilembus persalinus]|eukprot:KRX11225.1 ADP-ribosylation/Crystallin J1 [Pseudocohnilembus persalinus]
MDNNNNLSEGQKQAYLILQRLLQAKKEDQDYKELRAYGCIAGAFIGDSLGSYCEFENDIDEKVLSDVIMKQPGGGTFNLNPGQLTDDSEVALSLAYGLIEGEGKLDLNLIFKYYGIWILSPPFDCGITLGAAFGPSKRFIPSENWTSQQMQYQDALKHNQQVVKQENYKSQSNGSLMRITPLVIFCLNLSEEDTIRAVRAEIKLTHCDETLIQACISWVLVLKELINTGDAQKGFEKLKNYMKRNDCDKTLREQWYEQYVLKDEMKMIGTQNMGWLKIAWTYGLKFLKNWGIIEDKFQSFLKEGRDKMVYKTIYENLIAQMIYLGGDTDTNACIVGGLVGAIVGLQDLPELYLKNMLYCDVQHSNKQRHERYAPYNAFIVCEKLLKLNKLEIIDNYFKGDKLFKDSYD